jgi:hypothetical protein
MENEELIEIVEVEIFVRAGKEIPHARSYKIRVDRQHYVVHSHTINGRQILALAGKAPETFKLYQHRRGHQPEQIGPDHVVDLRVHCVERFTTMPKDTTEGLGTATLRRQFQLPPEDVAYLDQLGLDWETINGGGTLWLIIHGWQLPQGYNYSVASLALRIPPNYSDSQIDMVYFKPSLARVDGRSIIRLTPLLIEGQQWQQWSRHRTAANPWRPGQDDISSHLCMVDEWLRREFGA